MSDSTASKTPPWPFSETYAHPVDPLPEHLLRVAERAEATVREANGETRLIAYLAGLFHDVGKATPYFQEYLLRTHRKTALTPHAKSSAALSWWFTGALGLARWVRLAVFLAVLRHHGRLDCDGWHAYMERLRFDVEENDPVLVQLTAMDLPGIHLWLCTLPSPPVDGIEFPSTLPALDVHAVKATLLDREGASCRLRRAIDCLEQAVAFLAGFGGLLVVDKVDAALQGSHIERRTIPADAVVQYAAVAFRGTPSSTLASGAPTAKPLELRRLRISDEVLATWNGHYKEHLFTLTAPTGSGKTLTILNAALRIRARLEDAQHTPPRIVYCLPFTSVIDQNHGVFRDVLRAAGLVTGDDVILKHHHLVDGFYRTEDAEHDPDGAGQLLLETWQSEIVVTTFQQLLHALLSNKNANLKRAGQLAGALVLMDEVQAVPLRYWRGLRHLFQALACSAGTRFVLLTATRPLIFRPEDARELLPSFEAHFTALSRVRLVARHRTPVTLDEFTARFIAEQQPNPHGALIVLNRRRAVREAFRLLREALPNRRLLALSTDLTPRDRRARIRLIRRWQRQGRDCIVVSTQLVEAGVDISFPVVHRDLAPLDAVIQSAGRCNRHDTAGAPGMVRLWEIHTEAEGGVPGKPHWQRVYDSPLIEVTREVLGDEREIWDEREFLVLSRAYFEGCWGRADQTPVDEWLAAGRFKTIEKGFELISEGPPTRALFVVGRDKAGALRARDEGLWVRYAAIQSDDTLSPVEKEKRFRGFKRAFFERVIQIYGVPDPMEPITRLAAGPNSYTPQTGFIALPEEDNTACIL
jgi:CRISPR-associated endonuclease/helicase Cas3